MQSEKSVEINCGAFNALTRAGNCDCGADFVVILFTKWHNDIQTVGRAALEQHDQFFLIRHGRGGHGPLQKRADLQKYGQTIGVMRDRIRTACAGGAADAAKKLDFKDLGIAQLSGLFTGGVPKMCEELAR